MSRSEAFEQHHRRYDEWFVRHRAVYESELLAVRALLPWRGEVLSLGVGTGRFAAPLGVTTGIDPSHEMLRYAAKRGISVVQGVAEALPFAPGSFAHVLCVTTICFVDDVAAMLAEAARVLTPGGRLVIGFIDRNSALGRHYLDHQTEDVFYRDATFFSANEVHSLLVDAGFIEPHWVETLSRPLNEVREIEPLRAGRGNGAFVVVSATPR